MGNYLTDQQISEMAQWILQNNEVSPLSHNRKVQLAAEHAADEYGKKASKSACLLAVKLANLGWQAAVQHAKRAA